MQWDLDSSEGVRWRRSIPGLAHSSPIVWGERIFVTTAIASDGSPAFELATSGRAVTTDSVPLEWKIYALERSSGEILWERVAAEGLPKTKRHSRSSPCNSTPATNGKFVAAIMGSQGLFCYSIEGELVWTKDLGVLDGGYVGLPEFQWGHASSPIFFRDRVIVQIDKVEDSYLAAYEADTGEEIWVAPRDELPSWCTPTVFETEDRAELITNGGNYARGYDPLTGEELWRFADRAEVKVPTPFVVDDVIYLAGGAPRGRQMVAIRVGGEGDVSHREGAAPSEQLVWRIQNGGPYTVTPIVYGGYFYTCTNNGILACHDAATGERLYRERLDGGFSASPVAAAGRLYLASEEGDGFVLEAGPYFVVLARNEMGETCMATPAISDDLLVVRTTSALYAIGS